jgi:hypothetical protein
VKDLENYAPQRSEWLDIWQRLPQDSRRQRFAEAQQREADIKAVKGRAADESERAAIARISKGDHSSFKRWQKRYEQYGFDGLVDWRLPCGVPTVPAEVRATICTLRQANADVDVDTIVKHVAKFHQFSTSPTTVKRILREAGLARRRGPSSGSSSAGEQRLELGGMKLIEAALQQTGYLTAMAEAVQQQVADMDRPDSPSPVDTSDRDEEGKFMPSYNERYRQGDADEVAPGFVSVEEKRIGLDPARLHMSGAQAEVIERKMLALMVSPLLGSGRWDGIRAPRGALLEELCGFAYMPSTLDLFTRELKYVGVSSTLWEVHAHLWRAQTADWGDERSAVVLYIDATNKPVWTELFSQSTKVTSVGRVMPSLESVYFHSGYGVPLWMMTYSGHAPLVKVVPDMLTRFREQNDGAEVGRIVVMDAESNSVAFLKSLEQGSPPRAWVTRLRPSLLEGKRIFNRTNYRPYRQGDRIRMGLVDLHDPKAPGKLFRIRVVEVERRSKATVTYLGASVLLEERDWKAEDIGGLYFDRWPMQEANFRAVNRAIGCKDVHGYGKRLVDNVAVITELDELDQKIRRGQELIEQRTAEYNDQQKLLHEQTKLLGRSERHHDSLTRQLQQRLVADRSVTPKLSLIAAEQKDTALQIRNCSKAIARAEKKSAQLAAQLGRHQDQLEQRQERKAHIESRRRIFQHDVELDSIFSVLKVGLVLTISFVLKNYFGGARMEPITFLGRFATLQARLRILPDLEILTFDYNQRDPDMMALLTQYCEAINARALRMRSGRVLRIIVDPAPADAPTPRTPPKWSNSVDRLRSH